MNSRTIILALAVGLLGIGLVMTIAGLFDEPPAETTIQPARAARAIEPYQIVTQDMIRLGDPVRARDARDSAAYPFSAVVGKMTTERLSPGDMLTALNAKSVEEVRFTDELGLEILSFSAGGEQLVGGRVRPGHFINLYGTATCPDKNDPEDIGTNQEIRIPNYCLGSEGEDIVVKIKDNLWVVGADAGGGRSASVVTPVVDLSTGQVTYPNAREQASTMITIAVPPETAVDIIEALKAKDLEPYVTLAANQSANIPSFSGSAPVVATPTFGLPPDLAATATALYNALNATAPPPPPRTGGGGSVGAGR
jgi:hypothetical protein